MARTTRPGGVAVLAVLVALYGILALVVALVLGVLAETITEFVESAIIEYGGVLIPDVAGFVEAMLLVIAVVAGWVGAGWAWWLTIILSALGIIIGIVSLPGGIITIIINALIMYYFTRSYVKEFFGT